MFGIRPTTTGNISFWEYFRLRGLRSQDPRVDIIYLLLLSDTDNLLSVWDNLLAVVIVI